MSWVTVSAAAAQVGRSPQWIRNQIHSGALPAHTQPAGSRHRLLIMAADLERLIAQLRIEPVSASVPAPATPASDQTPLTVDDVMLSGVMAENARLKSENVRLNAENRKLHAAIGALQQAAHALIDGLAPLGDDRDAVTG